MEKFNTKYIRPEMKGEFNSGEIITEQQYVSAEHQIMRMLQAGQRLAVSRKQFDFSDGEKIDENFLDPTRESNFDLSDASQLDQAFNAQVEINKNALIEQQLKEKDLSSNEEKEQEKQSDKD